LIKFEKVLYTYTKRDNFKDLATILSKR